MAEIVPECAQGCASIKHVVLDGVGGRNSMYVHGEYKTASPAGTYVNLRIADDKGRAQIMMSDLYYERETCVEVVERAHGNVLIAGLGIGMILHPILRKPDVRSLTVVEKYPEVVDLVAPTLPFDSRLSIVTADIFTWEPPPGAPYDVIWFDIWPDMEVSRLEEMERLHRRFEPYLNRENPRLWMESWHREETLRFAGLQKQTAEL